MTRKSNTQAQRLIDSQILKELEKSEKRQQRWSREIIEDFYHPELSLRRIEKKRKKD